MNRFSNRFAFVLFFGTFSAASAFAYRGDVAPGAFRQETQANHKIQMQGTLTCDLGAQNTGQACELLLHETDSGRTYHLQNTRHAMELLSTGNTRVSVEGKFMDAETVEVSQVSAL